MFTMLAIAAAFALVTAGYFPLSFLAYQFFRAEAIRDRMKLDFQLLGLFSAENPEAREEEFQTLYRKAYSPAQFVIYVALATVLTLLGFAVFYFRASITFMPSETLEPMFYGFLGAYIFSIQLIYRRYSTLDLQPQVYQYVVLRMVTVLAIIYTGVTALGASAADTEGLLPILAFIIGYFPDTGLRWFAALANQVFSQFQRRPREHPLSMIEGISMWHEARLKESGIDNAQNLATADIKELLLSTRFSGQQLIDWIDQAILYLYAGDNNIGKFREHNICTISDFRSIWKNANTRGEVAQMLGLTEVDLNFLYQATEEGPSLHHVTNYWGNLADYVEARVGAELENLRQRLEQMSRGLARVRQAAITRAAEARPEEKDVLQQVQELIDEIDEATPEEVVPELTDTAGYHLARGNLRYNASDYPGAIEAYTRAIELDPASFLAYYSRGVVYNVQGQHDQAIADLDRAIELNPASSWAYYGRGSAYHGKGEYDQAIADLDRAIELDPASFLAYYSRGVVYDAQGQHDQAITDYDRAIELNREYVDAYNNRGVAYTHLKEYERAFADFNRAIELNPEHAMAYYNMACVFSLNGDSDQALSWLRQAFEKDRTQGSIEHVTHAHTDSDFDPIRDDPRFQALLAEFAPE